MPSKRLVKSLVVFALAGFFVSSVGWAQTRRHDVSVSYGLVTMDQVTDVLESVLTVVITLGTFSKQNTEFSGAPFFTYHYSPNGRFGLGFAVGGYTSKGDLDYSDSAVGTFKETSYVGAFELDYRWIMTSSFQLYSGLGLGVRVRKGTYVVEGEETESTSKALPTYHLNLIGFRFGKKIGLFGEFGAGYKGVFNVGLNAQF